MMIFYIIMICGEAANVASTLTDFFGNIRHIGVLLLGVKDTFGYGI